MAPTEWVLRVRAASLVPGTGAVELSAVPPLQEHNPGLFQEFVASYEELMERALEQREFRVHHPLSEELQVLGEKLGALRAGPRDVVEIHSAALKHKRQATALPKMQAYVEEGRLMVLELMGHLASYYRRHVLESGQVPPAKEDRHA